MLKAILFAVLFAVAGLILFAMAAPLVLPAASLRTAGALAFPFIVIVCGGAGFVMGWRGRNK
jgi:hypothetical protein